MKIQRTPLLVLWTILTVLSTSFVEAQTTNATVNGLVMDSSNRVIAGAAVLAINDDTNLSYPTTTDKVGVYSLPALSPGRYRMQVSKAGFKTSIKPDIVLNVQDARAINFTLQVGAITDTITVEGGVPLLNTESAVVGTVIDRQFVENIPLNGRSFQSLITLTPGVVVAPSNANNSSGGQFSVNGQRVFSNGFTVDGVSANVGASPGSFGGQTSAGNGPAFTVLGTTQSMASIDALQEFKMQTSTYSAEYGRQPGGQISIITRSGTNQFHGNLSEYFRNAIFDANDWFANRAGQPKPAENQNDFGGTLGGPLWIPGLYNGHDRTFFFFSYEGLRLRQPNFAVSNVPTLCLRGAGSCPAGQSAAPASVRPFLNGYPLPNGADLGNGLAEFSAGYSDPSTLDAMSIRIDHSVNSKLTMFGRYNRVPSETVSRLAANSFSALNSDRLVAETFTVGATASLTPRVTNELRANYSTNGAYQTKLLDNFGGAVPPPRSALIPADFDLGAAQGYGPLLLFAGRSALPFYSVSGTSRTSQRQVNILDSLSYSVGSHQLKFGVDYRRLTPVGAFSSYIQQPIFLNQSQVIAGIVPIASIVAISTSNPIFTNFSAYGQDTWKVTSRLTATLGLRWDVNPPPSEANGRDALAVTQINDLATMQLAPFGTNQWNTSYKNFAPRLGVAYQLVQAPGRETVLRGGFGRFYDTGNDAGAANYTRYPYQISKRLSNVPYPLTSTQADPPAFPDPKALNPPYPQIELFDPALKLPYTLQWNAAMEQSIGKNQAFTISYVGAVGRRLLQSTLLSLSAINPKFTNAELNRNSATSDYNALQAQFQRRLSQGLQMLVSYTWSHALDSDSSGLTARAARRGNADFDIRHVLGAAATYNIPAPGNNPVARAILGQWSLDTNIHAQSGLPVDLVATSIVNPADGSFYNVRPNVNPGVPFYVNSASFGRKLNPAAFNSNIPAGESGNLGRNQVRGLGAWQVDFATHREFPVWEKLRLQFRAEGFNIFNHPNFGAIQTLLSAPNFGEPTGMLGRQLGGLNPLYQIGGPRSFQFAMKLMF